MLGHDLAYSDATGGRCCDGTWPSRDNRTAPELRVIPSIIKINYLFAVMCAAISLWTLHESRHRVSIAPDRKYKATYIRYHVDFYNESYV